MDILGGIEESRYCHSSISSAGQISLGKFMSWEPNVGVPPYMDLTKLHNI